MVVVERLTEHLLTTASQDVWWHYKIGHWCGAFYNCSCSTNRSAKLDTAKNSLQDVLWNIWKTKMTKIIPLRHLVQRIIENTSLSHLSLLIIPSLVIIPAKSLHFCLKCYNLRPSLFLYFIVAMTSTLLVKASQPDSQPCSITANPALSATGVLEPIRAIVS